MTGELKIPIADDEGKSLGSLQLITLVLTENEELIELLTAWRNEHRRSFLTQFTATASRTRRWLREVVVAEPSRRLFMIEDANGEWIGHLGVKYFDQPEAELDNLVRGRSGGSGQLMYWAEIALLHWLFADPKRTAVYLHVFTNNWIARNLHQAVGFTLVTSYPLRRQNIGDEIHLVVGSDTGQLEDFKYAKLVLTKADFYGSNMSRTGA